MKNTVFTLLLICACQSGLAQDLKRLADYRAEAEAAVDGVSVTETMRLQGQDDVILVDVRDSGELQRSGSIRDAVHVPRGMLEFYIDPSSSLHDELFSSKKKIVFYCATGGRSLLAAKLAKDMGVENPSHLEGGFRAWSRAGGDIDE